MLVLYFLVITIDRNGRNAKRINNINEKKQIIDLKLYKYNVFDYFNNDLDVTSIAKY